MEIVVDKNELQRRLNLSLDEKIQWTIDVYCDFLLSFVNFDNLQNPLNKVYIAFSAGKDSQTLVEVLSLLHKGKLEIKNKHSQNTYELFIKDKPLPVKVFSNTGLEFPEIVEHSKKFDNVVTLRPAQSWFDVVKNVGFLIGGKKISRMIKDIKNPTGKNEKTRTLYLTGITSTGKISPSFKLPKMWRKLINSPFPISDQCCDIFKKQPMKLYERTTKQKPIIATTVEESDMRRISYMQTGCNTYGKDAKCRPLSIWRNQDVWEFAKRYNVRFAEIYYDRNVNGKVVEGESSTGCIFCCVGQPKHIEARFERLSRSHPKIFDSLMRKTRIKEVFDYLGIKFN